MVRSRVPSPQNQLHHGWSPLPRPRRGRNSLGQHYLPYVVYFLAGCQALLLAPYLHYLTYSPKTFRTKGNSHFPHFPSEEREVESLSQGLQAVESHSNPGSSRAPTRNLSFSYLDRGAFSLKNPPDLVTPEKGCGLSDRHDLAGAPQSRAPGARHWAPRRGMTPPPGYLTRVWSPRGAGRSRSSQLAPPFPPPHSLPARPSLHPALALRAGIGRRAPGAGRGQLLALQSRPLAAATAHSPDRATPAAAAPLLARSAPDSRSRDAGPERPADGRAAVDAWPVARSMDSDSGEQSEGEPVTAAGTEGVVAPQPEGWGQEEGRPGQEVARIPSSCQAGGRAPAAGFLPGRDWGSLCAEFALGFLSHCTWARRSERRCVCWWLSLLPGSCCGFRWPGLGGGGEGSGNPRPVICCS